MIKAPQNRSEGLRRHASRAYGLDQSQPFDGSRLPRSTPGEAVGGSPPGERYLYRNAITVPFQRGYHRDVINAASYSRRSEARGRRNDDRSVTEQDDLAIRAASTNGWDLPPSRMYRDNDLSASRYTTKERPDWTLLHKDLSTGTLDMLILWETSRAWRKLYEWAPLVELCADNKTLIHITADNRTYDANDDRDWAALMEDGLDSEKESRKIRKRVKRALDANRMNGKPHSPPAYGYRIEVDPTDYRKKIRVPVPEQVKNVIEVITQVGQSVPVAAVARSLNQEGIPSPSVAMGMATPRSKTTPLWTNAMVRKICTNFAYIGKLECDGVLVDGTWPAIVEEELFYKAYNLLKDPKRRTTKPGSSKHLLTFLAQCDICKDSIRRMGGKKPDLYKCGSPESCVTIRMEWVDLYIEELTCQRLAKNDVYDLLTNRDEKHKQLATDLEALRAEHQQALELRAKGKLSLIALSQEEGRIFPLISQLESQLRPVTIPRVLDDLTREANGNVAIIRKRWAALEIPAKRDAIKTLFKSITIGKVVTQVWRYTTEEQVERTLRERVSIEWANE